MDSTWERLDCSDELSALRSLASGYGQDIEEFRAVVTASYDAPPGNDPAEWAAKQILRCAEAQRPFQFRETALFHATRVPDPDRIRTGGLRPLPEVLPVIWEMLHDFVASDMPLREWDALRERVESDDSITEAVPYRAKLARLRSEQAGPHAQLVRDLCFNTNLAGGQYDYLRCPEIIHDISSALSGLVEKDVAEEYCARSRPIIVKFKARVGPDSLLAAVAYVRAKLTGKDLPPAALGGGYTPNGVAVPPGDIISIEPVAE